MYSVKVGSVYYEFIHLYFILIYFLHRPYTNRRSMGIVPAVRRECAVLLLLYYYAHAQ